MRRILVACLVIVGATAAFAANPYYLDRNGVLWTAAPTTQGLALTGTQNGNELVRSVVPFPISIPGANDTQIQVAADALTGKVAVVWQRNWNATASEIMLAVWNGGDWERVEHLDPDLTANPRNPAIRLTRVATTDSDPSNPADPSGSTVVQDSFLHVAWWTGADQSHGSYALLRLTDDPGDSSSLEIQNLDQYAMMGFPCEVSVPATTLEYPVFASQDVPDHAQLLFGSQNLCLFQVLEIHFGLEPLSISSTSSAPTIAQRRRHTPIFGVNAAFPMSSDMNMAGTRLILGTTLNPVAYRVADDSTIQYVTFSSGQWSPVRTLTVNGGLKMDQAIPLVENLAR